MLTRIYQLNKNKHDLSNIKLVYSDYIQEPMIINGFNLFMMKNREKLNIVKNLPESQKTIHHIFNEWDITIPSNNEKSISSIVQKNLNSTIKDDNFYKLWEIFNELSLLKDKEPITTICIGTEPTTMVQAIINFRKLNSDKYYKKDLYCANSIYDDTIKCFSDTKLYINESFNNKKDTIKLFKKGFLSKTEEVFKKKKNANLIICDCELNWFDINYQEQEAFRIILGEIIFSLHLLEKEGSMIIKIYDTYTLLTIKMISIFSSFFKESIIIKPLTCSDAITEKYLIGKGYIPHKDNLHKLTKIMEELENDKKYIIDIDNIIINNELTDNIININQTLSDLQYTVINKMYKFICDKNYFGIEYHTQISKQLENTSKWIDKYLH